MKEELRKRLMQAGADIDGALERFMGNEGLYTRFARGFREDMNYNALLKAMEAGDVKAAFNAAHTLKGVTGNLSFNRLYERVSEVVEPLRREDLEEAGKKLPALTDAYEELIRVLEEWEA